MWKDEMGSCTRVCNGFFLSEFDIDAFGGLEGIVVVIEIREGCRGSSGIIRLGLFLGRGAVTGDMVASLSSWTGYRELLLTVGVGR